MILMTYADAITPTTGTSTTGAAPSAWRRAAVVASLLSRPHPAPRPARGADLEAADDE